MKATYRALAGLIAVLVLVQAAAIAFGTFGLLNFVEDGGDYTKSLAENGDVTGATGQLVHSVGAAAIAAVAILRLAVSFFARIEGGVRWAVIVFLVVLLQWVLAAVAYSAPAVGALHGINAFVMFGVAMMAAQRAKAATTAEAPSPSRQTV
jgi:hypothetical protein